MTVARVKNKSGVKTSATEWEQRTGTFEKGAIRLSFSGVWLKKTHDATIKEMRSLRLKPVVV